MSKEQAKASPKKELRNEVTRQLEQSLTGLKSLLSEKKFSARLKKAAKVLTEGLEKDKKEPVKKAPSSKKAQPLQKAVKAAVPASGEDKPAKAADKAASTSKVTIKKTAKAKPAATSKAAKPGNK